MMLVAAVLILSAVVAKAVLTTRSQPPFIASITPTLSGSAEGGSELTIIGANFAQDGLFSSRAVFVGGQTCKIIEYYSSNEKILCITPKCVTPACLSDQDWQDYEDVSLSIYVSTVEGILEGFSTFRYNGGYTPSIYKMQHNAWATGVSQVVGKLMAQNTNQLTLRIGDQFADLGAENEINDVTVSTWSRQSVLNYRPPSDMTAGFYNLSLFVDAATPDTWWYGSGLARMYPNQESFLYENSYLYDDNFNAALSGEPFSLCLLPVVTKVTPDSGSIAGGTEVTVRGHGFSAVKEDMVVYVAGRQCDVTRTGAAGGGAKTEEFRCVTRPADAPAALRTSLLTSANEFIEPDKLLTSTRNYGSAGWWMKMWALQYYTNNQMTDANVQISAGVRQALSFSFIDLFGWYWPGQLGYLSQNSDPQVFAIDFATYLVAPYTGTHPRLH
jgi:hypothetical protein